MGKIMHCFGTEETAKLTPEIVREMLTVSKVEYVPINTHCIDGTSDWKDLPLGYGSATWRTVSEVMDLSNFKPLWNINLPTSNREAVEQCRKIVKLGGKRPIKLEVLDQSHKWTCNSEVVEAARTLIYEDKFEIWPLITPDLETFLTLEKMGCPLIRMMGSAISSCNGINQEYIDVMKEIIKIKKVKIMMDGGIGGKEDVLNALELGFDYVLVNSCLFLNNKSPVQMLKIIVESIS